MKSYLDVDSNDIVALGDLDSECFLQLAIIEAASNEKVHEKNLDKAMEASFLYQVLKKRLEAFSDAKVSICLLAFLASLSTSPGDAVMWAFTLHCIYQKEQREINCEILTQYFPDGVPNEKAKMKIWDAQKGFNLGKECDNYVDQTEAWEEVTTQIN